MRIQPASLFSPRWEVFWGTTYSFELELFDEYLFRRLGEPPLNTTVLVDFATLARTWEAIRPGEEWRVQRVNSLYLVRAAGSSQGRFHPKTYFFANAKEGVLLVGSGNLSLPGIEEGHELFCRFDSTDPHGLAAILSWRDWMKILVDQTEDELLGQRWFRLRQTTKEWLKGKASPSLFITNRETSFLDQLLVEGWGPTDELHAMAPFFDRDCKVLDSLLRRSRPRKVFLYLGRGTSVDGKTLREVLGGTQAEVTLSSFDPPRFVHAKLLALIRANKARILSGSANLSRAALTSTLDSDSWANTEACVLTETTAEVARGMFEPPDLELRTISVESLAEFSFEEPEASLPLPIRLLSAQPSDDDTVEVKLVGEERSDLFLTSATTKVRLKSSTTVEPFNLSGSGNLVWLTDDEGVVLSNRVPVDDPAALRRQLEARRSAASDRPRELDASDMQSPIGRVLVRLHNEFIFDLDELESLKHAERANEEESSQTESSDFWERLAREELQVDPRAGSYRRFGGQAPFEEDEVLLLLRMMLDRTPEGRHAVFAGGGEGEEGEPKPGTPWTPTQRLQVRLMNVLTRWGRALSDPRMNWLQPFASVRNFQALLYALAELWESKALPEYKVKAATSLIFGSFVRAESADGYLFLVGDKEREEARRRIPPEARDVATTLAYLGIRPRSEWKDNIFEWQAWLVPCLEMGIVRVTEEATSLISRISKEEVGQEDLAERLQWAREYIDDPRWCRKMEHMCGLDHVRFSKEKFAYELVLDVKAYHNLVDDPGVVRLIRNALDFRRADGIVVMSGIERIAVRLGERAFARMRDREMYETREPVNGSALARLEESGLSLREAMISPDTGAAAS